MMAYATFSSTNKMLCLCFQVQTMMAAMLSVTLCFLLSQIPHAVHFSNETFFLSEENTARVTMTIMITDSLNNFLTPLCLLVTGAAFRKKLWGLLNGCSRR